MTWGYYCWGMLTQRRKGYTDRAMLCLCAFPLQAALACLSSLRLIFYQTNAATTKTAMAIKANEKLPTVI